MEWKSVIVMFIPAQQVTGQSVQVAQEVFRNSPCRQYRANNAPAPCRDGALQGWPNFCCFTKLTEFKFRDRVHGLTARICLVRAELFMGLVLNCLLSIYFNYLCMRRIISSINPDFSIIEFQSNLAL
jgi:hypothetical protein